MAFTREFLVAACLASAVEGFQMGRIGGFAKPSVRAATSPLALYMDAALILQNKGGGHGEIGFHIAKQLRAKGVDVHMLQAADAKLDKAPFKDYGELEAMGVKIDVLDLADPAALNSALAGKSFTHVFDNFAKNVDTVQTVAGKAKAEWNVKNYAYVSSAGMYEASVPQPMMEVSLTKTTGQREVEMYLDEQGLPWTSFRPQYIYGPKTNKRDYLDWFFHRVTRDRVCPLPGDGKQLASVSNVEDVASMMTAVVGKEDAAKCQVFNCGTETCVSYEDICKLVGQTVGKEVKTAGYNPKDFDLPKGAFPFRNTPFYVSPAKAKQVLGWSSTRTLEGDMGWYYESYKAAGQDTKDIDFSADDMILSK